MASTKPWSCKDSMSLLTDTERKIAELAAQGHSMREIAEELGWSPASIKVYLSTRIYPKLGVKSQPGLIRWWIEHVEQRGHCGQCLLRRVQLFTIGEELPQ